MLLGHQSRREVLRSRFRTLAAMRVQARDQGRHLGGRPPYGYRLVDAGPHPNRAHARWGRRLHRLDPDPQTAPHVRWIFAQRLAGDSTAGIARALNLLGVPSPAAHDRLRNRHRVGRSVDAAGSGGDSGQPALHRPTGVEPAVHRSPGDLSRRQAHQRGFGAAVEPERSVGGLGPVGASAAGQRGRLRHRADDHRSRDPGDGQTRRYRLTGLVVCGICGRRADAHWVHGRPGYRCRHGRTSASPPLPGRPKSLYWREDLLPGRIARELPSAAVPRTMPGATTVRRRPRRSVGCGEGTATPGRLGCPGD